jgi:hypothetical protein
LFLSPPFAIIQLPGNCLPGLIFASFHIFLAVPVAEFPLRGQAEGVRGMKIATIQ